jgi:hypothetical protein
LIFVFLLTSGASKVQQIAIRCGSDVGIELAQAWKADWICGCSAPELNNERNAMYRKATHSTAAFLVTQLSQPLKVVVQHSRVADQTHLLRSLYCARSDHSATPRAENLKCRRLRVVECFIGLRSHVFNSCVNKSRSSFRTRPDINDQS